MTWYEVMALVSFVLLIGGIITPHCVGSDIIGLIFSSGFCLLFVAICGWSAA